MQVGRIARPVIVLVGCAFACALPFQGNAVRGKSDDDKSIAVQVKELFVTRCFHCHGLNGQAESSVFVLDHDRLVAKKVLIPGDIKSPLYQVIGDRLMPMDGDLSANEIELVKTWVTSGAPNWNQVQPTARTFSSEASILQAITADLEKTDELDRPFIRYYSIAHLRNGGVPDEELDGYRIGLSRLLNSLSWHRTVVPAAPIDEAKTILRIDLRDYRWTAETWKQIVAAYPYGVVTNAARRAMELSGASVPYVRADWFVAEASVPPLYNAILGLPSTVSELEKLLGVNSLGDLSEVKNVARGGVRKSGVSEYNRVVERFDSLYGAYWRSYDFASGGGEKNIFLNPIELHPDGGEYIFNLPNGLQAYFISNKLGARLDVAPPNIVSDSTVPGAGSKLVVNGRSCMACHFTGMNTLSDDVRPVLIELAKANARTDFDLSRATRLYPGQSKLDALFAQDSALFGNAVRQAGGEPATRPSTEPMSSLARRFAAELNADLAAAEAGMERTDFEKRVAANKPLLQAGLAQLLVSNGGIARDAWEKAFPTVVQELGLGRYVAPQSPLETHAVPPNASSQPLTQGDSSLRDISRDATVTTSSVLPPDPNMTFSGSNLIDGKLETSWQPQAKETFGVGEWATFRFNGPRRIARIAIANGYQTTYRNQDLFLMNGRLGDIEVELGEQTIRRTLDADVRGFVDVLLDPPVLTDTITLRVLSVHQGSRWPDLAISEIRVLAVEPGPGNQQRTSPAIPPQAPGVLCSDFSGNWKLTTTVTSALKASAVGVRGYYNLSIGADCQATIEKLGFEKTFFTPENIQRGAAMLRRDGASWIFESAFSRGGSVDYTAEMRFEFGTTLSGTWRYTGPAWTATGFTGSLVGTRQ